MSRFDYVEYDEDAIYIQGLFKDMFTSLEKVVSGGHLKSPRAKALVLTKLEEAYCWVGKAIRDDQIERNGKAELQESRSNE